VLVLPIIAPSSYTELNLGQLRLVVDA
jgi:hypothetical protein